MTKSRLHRALASYAILAAIAIAVLKGSFLWIILILFAGLAAKSWIAYKREQM